MEGDQSEEVLSPTEVAVVADRIKLGEAVKPWEELNTWVKRVAGQTSPNDRVLQEEVNEVVLLVA